ncbi:zinc finger protein 679-like isoform X2 [Dendropsophus ebraccatus]|uniref:zinc finger protein 679-like isoform X2 n=1 Tax=Dendropsophus ebraccatus TaxID=150705 RepID=UPI0038320528
MNFPPVHSAPGSLTSVRFKEVVVYFSEEEWSRLDSWQKELYSNVMRDIHTALLSLGYSILHPDVLCRVRRDHEPCISISEEDKKGLCFPSASASVLSPDIVFRIKHDEEVRAEDGGYKTPKSELGFPAEMSDVLNNEEGKPGGDQTGDQKHSPSNADLPSEDGNVSAIKTETPDCNKLPPAPDITEAASDKNTDAKIHQTPKKTPILHRDEHAGKGEESLLSIVLRRGNAGGLYIPNSKYTNSYKDLNHPRSVREKEKHYQSQRPFLQGPNSNNLCARPMPLQHCAHQMDRPFRCHVCDKGFKTLGILNVHMKRHSGVRPYQCSECGKSFRDNWNLKVHQKIHTGETPYRCAICDKGFIQYATYMKHQRIHTGEKPYSCCYCNKRFTNSSNLVRHYRTHTGEKPYACMECGKSFSYNTSLIQHKRVHKVDPDQSGTNGPSSHKTNRGLDYPNVLHSTC